MAIAIQRHTAITQPILASLNVEALSDGIHPVYLQGKLYKITNQQVNEPRIACVISLLNNLASEPETDLQALKEQNRVGALHIHNGKVQALILTENQRQFLEHHGVNEIALKMNQFLLLIKKEDLESDFLWKRK